MWLSMPMFWARRVVSVSTSKAKRMGHSIPRLPPRLLSYPHAQTRKPDPTRFSFALDAPECQRSRGLHRLSEEGVQRRGGLPLARSRRQTDARAGDNRRFAVDAERRYARDVQP